MRAIRVHSAQPFLQQGVEPGNLQGRRWQVSGAGSLWRTERGGSEAGDPDNARGRLRGPFSRRQSRAESSCLRLAAEGFVHEATVPPGPARSWVAQGRAMGLGGWCVAWAPGSPQLLRAAYCRENQRPGKVLVLSRSQLCHSLNPAAGPGGGPARLTSASAWSRRSAEPSLGGRPGPSHPGPAPQGAQAVRKTGALAA